MEEQLYLGKQFHAKHQHKPVRVAGFDTLPWMITHRIITKNFILVTKWCLFSLEFRERTLVATSEILTSQYGNASDSLRGKGEISSNQLNDVRKETRWWISDMKIDMIWIKSTIQLNFVSYNLFENNWIKYKITIHDTLILVCFQLYLSIPVGN